MFCITAIEVVNHGAWYMAFSFPPAFDGMALGGGFLTANMRDSKASGWRKNRGIDALYAICG